MTKRLSAVEEALAEDNVLGFPLTDDIVIAPPSRKMAELIQKTDDPEQIMRIVLGDQYEAATAVLEELPIKTEIRVLQKMLAFFTDDLPTSEDVIASLGLKDADAATIAQAVAAKAAA